jgi:hypothetical protein
LKSVEMVSSFMACDEAPAATIGDLDEKRDDPSGSEPAKRRSIPKTRSDQRRCCGNPSWKGQRASSATAGAICYIQIMCQCGTGQKETLIQCLAHIATH